MNQDLSIEFADWIDCYGYIKVADDETQWIYWDGVANLNTKYTTKELFEEFLKRRELQQVV